MVTLLSDDVFQTYEKALSTRTSFHAWTKYAGLDATLATAGTAQNLYVVSRGLPTVNLAPNPSFETGDPPTGYTAAGATLSQSNTVAYAGTYSALVNPDNAAAGEGFYWVTPSLGSGGDTSGTMFYLCASAYFQDNADSGDDARIVIADSSGTTLVNGNTVTLSSSWQRSSVRYLLPPGSGAAYRIYFSTVTQHNTSFYVDAFQPEVNKASNVTAYADGAQGLNYEWLGTAHASQSIRRPGIYVVRGMSIHVTSDTYIAFDHTASSSMGFFLRAGSDWWNDHPLDIRSNISFINVNVGETPRVHGVVHGVHEG